jgi:hypothetical protein
MNSIKTAAVCGLEKLGTCIAATSQPSGGVSSDFSVEGRATGAGTVRDAGKSKQLKRRGYRVRAEDFAATPTNTPSLHAFGQIANWEKFETKLGMKLAVVCCLWPQCRGLGPTPGTSIFAPRRL